MKLVVAGSRDLNIDEKTLFDILKTYLDTDEVTEIVSGNCSGVDKSGEFFANIYKKKLKIFPANWELHGKAAGPIRNNEMAHYADCAIIIVNKENSRGSLNMKSCMEKLNKPVFLHHI